MTGVSGIALVASVMSFSKVPAEVIDLVVDSTVSVLRSASKEPTVKSCVLTSSTSAAFRPQPNVEFDVEEDSWNMDCIKAAFELPDNDPRKGGYVYAASKVSGEKAAWKFVADEKPCFSFNVIIPSVNIGPVIDPTNYTSTAGWFKDIFDGNLGVMGQYPPRK
jgi:nucleoside-diphosphate-sugar epimerase